MTSSGPSEDLRTPTPEQVAAEVEREGYAVLRDVVDASLVTALRRRIDELMEELAIPFGGNDFLGRRTRRIFNLLARDPLFERIVTHDAILPVVEQVLDHECLLSSLTAIEMHPGETLQPLHADDGSIPLPKPHPPLACVALVALSDFDERNGGTRVVPGSHRFDHSPGRDERHSHAAEHAVMSAGSAVVYHGSLWHGGGANRSDAPRMGIVVNYCAGYIRQEECQLLALRPEQVAAFSPRTRALVGYGTYHGLHGHVDQRNPAELIDPSAETDMIWRRIK
jgi:ectoine hydroxylase-related dioxygenase (phytanoyl-CoA dioxygenase family)